jgi:2-phospho-L-lactate guanylyltransferase
MSGVRSGLWAVVPVKLFGETKQRLAPLLAREERAALARSMLRDVLSTLAKTPMLAGMLVVTRDAAAASIARAAGALVIDDEENAGTSAAGAQAVRHLAPSTCAGILIIPADVPLITPADVEHVIAAHGTAPAVTLVPASADGGTNALASSPPDAISFCFGEESFVRHCDAARARGIEPQIVRIPRIGQDIDRPEDVASFLSCPSPTHTYAYLRTLGLSLRACEGAAIPGIPARFVRHGIAQPVLSLSKDRVAPRNDN